jgi:predicted  nucleic acid-binding Zn-ribbon protein
MTFHSSKSSNSNQCAEAMSDRIAELEAEISKLKDELHNSQTTGGLSKSDHIKYVNQLHEVYRGEIDKVEKEKNDLSVSFSSKLDDLKYHLR